MDFSTVRSKLMPSNFHHYNNESGFIRDVQQIFTNCYVFNGVGVVLWAARVGITGACLWKETPEQIIS